MKIGIACDHRGYKLKENLKEILKVDQRYFDLSVEVVRSVKVSSILYQVLG